MRQILLGLMLLLFSFAVMAAEERNIVNGTPVWLCLRTADKINIDGVADEVSWKNAPEITELYEIRQPENGGPLKLTDGKLKVKLLHDAEYLYVFATIADCDIVADPESAKRSNQSTMFLDGDVFELFIQADPKQSIYYEFHVNPFNAQWNARYVARNYMANEARSWRSGFKSAVKIDGTINRLDNDRGWTVEMAIPLAAVTDPAGHAAVIKDNIPWRISFCMYDYQFYFDDCDNGSSLKYFSTSRLERINFHERKFYNSVEFK